MEICEKISKILSDVKCKKPLVHNITNYVTVNDCANIILALGASPVMADDIEEVEEMVSISSALVINVGTLNYRTIESMIKAGKKANEIGIPVILDPVGIGTTTLRTKTVERLINKVKFSVIRGNMSEIKILAGIDAKIKGVDSEDTTKGAKKIARELALKLNSVIAITGEKDTISDGNRVCTIENGHKMLAEVTGTGCMTTALIGAFCGVSQDYYLAAVSGIASMGIAGEKAYRSLEENQGVGTFRVRIFDNIYNLKDDDFIEGGKIYEC
ncbi:hydroxyethylthiazole kinase [Clostridium tepidiprofundi DSM 19306]|uniref:Hydroxyethylthiazole kinase n=1 Tax=Clostridium tepidiprofundi DSM 19306 TaxID=1121338 RepID=A0A151ASI8_9CLOT|nr:hydroxyethylthiazole kinase [Clostridium tepidiprofundi]KYH30609.1 hydroxyethylthiazole kinase [Clostridium tepidiprofundi DSM 19306]